MKLRTKKNTVNVGEQGLVKREKGHLFTKGIIKTSLSVIRQQDSQAEVTL